MKKLVIVESPSKSKTIEKYLGEDYQVVSSKGHIRDLATTGKGGLGIDVENGFKPTYVINKDKISVVKDLKSKVKQADEVYLSTDPDREGEAIAWHLAQELNLDLNQQNRVVFNEITKDAVRKAFLNPKYVDMDLVHSQETRRMLDRIIGFKLSTLLQSKIKSKSAGRVQSVALKLICEREKEIQAFIPEEYWTIHAAFVKDGIKVNAELSKVAGKKPVIKNEEEANAIIQNCGKDFVVSKVNEKLTTRSARLPFITSTMQQEASTKLNFSAKKTMQVAQRLYEGVSIDGEYTGLITYMRTDSTRLSDTFVSAAKALIAEKWGKEYIGYYRTKNDANAQDAHEAIRPTSLANLPEKIKDSLTNDQYRLYRLIYYRALASLMANVKLNSTTVTFTSKDYDFTASGSVMVFDGYLKAYREYESSKNEELPKFTEAENVSAGKVEGKQHFTEPPLRYSEARLIKELEELGIGRPSTYAMILDTIVQRKYVTLEKSSEGSKTKVFVPTEQGNLTNDKLEEYFNQIINVEYTANMEKELDKIADGSLESLDVLTRFYDDFMPLVDNAYAKMEKVKPESTGEVCPECGKELVIRDGKYGKFISCSGYPKCKYTRNLETKEKEEPEKLGIFCPECGGELIKRKSRYGTYFIGCSNYPTCHYIKPDENAKKTQRRFYPRKKKVNA